MDLSPALRVKYAEDLQVVLACFVAGFSRESPSTKDAVRRAVEPDELHHAATGLSPTPVARFACNAPAELRKVFANER